MLEHSQLPIPRLKFNSEDPRSVSSEKLKGLQSYGPYRGVQGAPRFAFVFPKGYSEQANSLFHALAGGVDMFKGIPTMFRMRFAKEQVEAITGFELGRNYSEHDKARAYADAIQNWVAAGNEAPNLFFILHGRTPDWQEDTPYHQCKRMLLELGHVSQSVTLELIGNKREFGWSAANIALAAFCKLGGVPWVVHREQTNEELVIGIGRAESQDQEDRSRRRTTAFTTCLTSRGEFRFSSVGKTTTTKPEYLSQLSLAVQDALLRAKELHSRVSSISIYVTKEFGHDEMAAVATGVKLAETPVSPEIYVLKVTDEDRFFVVDSESKIGVPKRGTSVSLSGSDHLLYTEGSDDTKTWRNRLPTAIRVRQYPSYPNGEFHVDALPRILDLSQVNYRGFNATSKPAVMVYSDRVAKLLESGLNLAGDRHSRLLESMWFL